MAAGDVATALALVRAGAARCVHGQAFPCDECKRLVRTVRFENEAAVGRFAYEELIVIPPRVWFTTDHRGHTWYPLSTAQWGIPHLSGETDSQWRERVLREADDDEGLGW